MSLAGKRIFITGGSRGIGLAIALRAARDGASVAIAAKTAEVNPKLPELFIQLLQRLKQPGESHFQFNATCAMKPRLRRQLLKLLLNSAALIF